MNFPMLIAGVTLVCLYSIALIGAFLRRRTREYDPAEGHEYEIVLTATLTLLGLLIGFSFSMAINRYDLRKSYEEEEANAIGTEYLRAELLPDSARLKVQEQLIRYLNLRIKRYEAHASRDTSAINSETAQLQREMWNETKDAASASPNPLMAAAVTGMNDVINRQGYTQAARSNRIPLPAWGLMAAIALFSNFLIGFAATKVRRTILLVVPLAIAVSFMLIADIDSPQGGLIRVVPQNLVMLADSLQPK